jgi:hypothetical protein
MEEDEEITDRVDEINRTEQTLITRTRDEELKDILNTHPNELEQIQAAYQTTIAHWPTALSTVVTTPKEMLRELKRIGRAGDYTAVEEFVSHLVITTNSQPLVDELNQWGQQYYPNRNWAALNAQIQAKFEARGKDFQPAILVRIRLAEEATSQNDNIPHYQPEAFLIEDLETYQKQGKQRQGYHALASAEAPFPLDEMEAKMQPLLYQWLRQAKQILPDCEHDPEFYIYLPKSLLHLNVDYWPIDTSRRPNRLGHSYKVVICCIDRLEGPYPVEPWREFWNRHQTCLTTKACDVFAEGNTQDIDDLIDVLEEAAESDTTVGLKVNAAPCAPDSETLTAEADEFFEELFLSGLPLAIWGRCQIKAICNSTELGTLLSADTLGNLLQVIQKKRKEARRSSNPPESHIGHHLSLLRDNPTLIPPTNKRQSA